jgi:hypothetical protein
MIIEELFRERKLSVRTLNVCQYNGLTNLRNILLFQTKNGSFLKLRNCGKLSNDELEKICEEFIDFEQQFITNFLLHQDQISDIIQYHFNYLSVRYQNLLKQYLHYDLSASNVFIKLVSDQEFNILRLGNFGSAGKVEIEGFLSEMSLLYKHLDAEEDNGLLNFSKKSKLSTFDSLISNLTRKHRSIINGFIEININHLSVRGKNAISAFLNGDIKVRNVSEKILDNKRFNLALIQNVGAKTIRELEILIQSIKDYILKIAEVKDDKDLAIYNYKIFVEKTFSHINIPSEIIQSPSIFKLIDYLLNNGGIFEKSEKKIFNYSFRVFNDAEILNLDQIADKIGISRERARQIRKGILSNLFERFSFLKNVEDDLFQKYGLDSNLSLIKLDQDLNNHINSINNTNFTVEFNTFLIYVFYSDKFVLIGEIQDVLQSKYFNARDRHNWQGFYLVRKEIAENFNFQNFVNNISQRINNRIEESYCFIFKSFLIDFSYSHDYQFISSIEPIAEIILNQEFNLYLNLNEEIVFHRNTLKQVGEYAIDALEELGIPSKIEEIFNVLNLKNPGVTKSPDSLRGSLQKSFEIIYFGRSSTYGLKKWETEKEGIKGGTIKDIVHLYLMNNNEPIHVLELLQEVHKYREQTTAKNILTNLKLDSQKQYSIFNQSFVGLKTKNYDSILTKLPKFLGKKITSHISKLQYPNRLYIEDFFAKKLKLSHHNMALIIENLIQQNFILIDDNNNLSV